MMRRLIAAVVKASAKYRRVQDYALFAYESAMAFRSSGQIIIR